MKVTVVIVTGRYVTANWDVEGMAKKGKEMAADARAGRWLMTKVLIFLDRVQQLRRNTHPSQPWHGLAVHVIIVLQQ